MLRIVDTNGKNPVTVTRGVFENLYRDKGYTIIPPKSIENIRDVVFTENKTVEKDKKNIKNKEEK